MKNYYDILGVSKTASTEEIKKAYRKLSVKFHPDKNENDDYFSEMFKAINEAHSILSDNKQRQSYDSRLYSTADTRSPAIVITDELVQAACLVVANNSASMSLIQRKLKVGFTVAGNLIDELCYLGIVSSSNGTATRTLLVNEHGLKNIISTKASGINLNIVDQYLSKFKAISQSINSTKFTNSTQSIWTSVAKWRKIKFTLLAVDILLVVILMAEPKLPSFNNQQVGRVIAQTGLNLRSQPNSQSNIVVAIPSNEKVIIMETSGPQAKIGGKTANWIKVRYKKHEGWVWGGFIKELK